MKIHHLKCQNEAIIDYQSLIPNNNKNYFLYLQAKQQSLSHSTSIFFRRSVTLSPNEAWLVDRIPAEGTVGGNYLTINPAATRIFNMTGLFLSKTDVIILWYCLFYKNYYKFCIKNHLLRMCSFPFSYVMPRKGKIKRLSIKGKKIFSQKTKKRESLEG